MTALAGRRVLMTTDAVGGVWQYAVDLARQLAGAGCEVLLAVLGPPPGADQRRHGGGCAGVRIVETGLPLDWMCTDAGEARMVAAETARLAAAWSADLVHCNSPALVGAADFPVPVVAAAHGCISTWWQAARAGPVDPALRWHGEWMRRGLTAADAAIAPSASFAATLKATYRLARPPLVVHNGRAPIHAADERPPINAALTVGRMWDPVKNGVLLDAVAARIDLRLLAAGACRGPHGEATRFTHLVALGEVPEQDLAALLARRPIMVSAARFEPFGLAVLEGAAAGCALVLSDIATFRELWEGAALFAPPGDAAGFAAAIARLHADPALRSRMGAAARARAANYTPEASAAAIMAIYRRLLAQREIAA